MPKQAEGFAVSDLTQYRVAPYLADGNALTGYEFSKYNSVTSGVSGLLDLGLPTVVVAKLHATIRYKNVVTLAWHYSQDGTTWTAANSSVSSGNPTDSALSAHSCAYGQTVCQTTLGTGGIAARYWRVSVKDSDVRVGSAWQCGGVAQPSSEVGLMELWAEGTDGVRLRELMLAVFAKQTVLSDGCQESVLGEGAAASGGDTPG